MQNYKDLKVWEKAHLFTLNMYEETRSFPKEELYGIISQLRRCAASVPANIAEGCGSRTNASFAHYLSEEKYQTANQNINEVKAMLISLISK